MQDLVEASMGTDVLKLHEGLKKAVSLLAIQLRTGTNSLDAFLLQACVPSVPSSLCSCGKGQHTARVSSSSAPGTLVHNRSCETSWGICLTFQGFLGLLMDLEKPPDV
jgi:hypothetical protein